MATTATNRGKLLLSCGEVLNQLKFEKPLPCHGTARWYSMEGEGIRREPEGIRQSLLCGGVVQLVRTPACHTGGRGFESRRSRHLFSKLVYYPSRGGPTFAETTCTGVLSGTQRCKARAASAGGPALIVCSVGLRSDRPSEWITSSCSAGLRC